MSGLGGPLVRARDRRELSVSTDKDQRDWPSEAGFTVHARSNGREMFLVDLTRPLTIRADMRNRFANISIDDAPFFDSFSLSSSASLPLTTFADTNVEHRDLMHSNVILESRNASGTTIALGSIPLPRNSDSSLNYWQTLCTQLQGVYFRQAARAQHAYQNGLDAARRAEDGDTARVVDRLSELIDLIGEPAIASASFCLSQQAPEVADFSLLAESLAKASDQETRSLRVQVLAQWLKSNSAPIRYAAAAAIGEIGGAVAKHELQRLLDTETDGDVKRIARAYVE